MCYLLLVRKTAQLTETLAGQAWMFSGSLTEYSDNEHFMKKGFVLAHNSRGDTVRPQGEGTAAAV